MGVGRIFSRWEPIADFSRGSQKDFSRGTKSGEILFYPLESKKTIYFAKTLIGNAKFHNPLFRSRSQKILNFDEPDPESLFGSSMSVHGLYKCHCLSTNIY